MSNITKDISYPYIELDYIGAEWVDDLRCQGLDVYPKSIQWSLENPRAAAFEGDIMWEVFLQKYPHLTQEHPVIATIIMSNQGLVGGEIFHRNFRCPTMEVSLTYDWDTVEHGMFAGMEVSELPDGILDKLERDILSICNDEADALLSQLDAEYEYQVEEYKQSIYEQLREEYKEVLEQARRWALAQPDGFLRPWFYKDAPEIVTDVVDVEDLELLGVVEYRNRTYRAVEESVPCAG